MQLRLSKAGLEKLADSMVVCLCRVELATVLVSFCSFHFSLFPNSDGLQPSSDGLVYPSGDKSKWIGPPPTSPNRQRLLNHTQCEPDCPVAAWSSLNDAPRADRHLHIAWIGRGSFSSSHTCVPFRLAHPVFKLVKLHPGWRLMGCSSQVYKCLTPRWPQVKGISHSGKRLWTLPL